jgi:hypothetical protein
MPDDMGLFRVDIAVENPARPGERRPVNSVLVDTGAELSWIPVRIEPVTKQLVDAGPAPACRGPHPVTEVAVSFNASLGRAASP